ncbi:hypothetical protein EJ04DRAFT_129050 [Polyplosphaeria fusca]|uniref:Uncharacterized protein n=1 Tax=Polyplosphaeria fusca TaxID=682080 RepID=A0A9P4UV14_9PLEO|nr:hypothetical protein EJ04DRAFT_129050 [Polyplosphaeria fusca]
MADDLSLPPRSYRVPSGTGIDMTTPTAYEQYLQSRAQAQSGGRDSLPAETISEYARMGLTLLPPPPPALNPLASEFVPGPPAPPSLSAKILALLSPPPSLRAAPPGKTMIELAHPCSILGADMVWSAGSSRKVLRPDSGMAVKGRELGLPAEYHAWLTGGMLDGASYANKNFLCVLFIELERATREVQEKSG